MGVKSENCGAAYCSACAARVYGDFTTISCGGRSSGCLLWSAAGRDPDGFCGSRGLVLPLYGPGLPVPDCAPLSYLWAASTSVLSCSVCVSASACTLQSALGSKSLELLKGDRILLDKLMMWMHTLSSDRRDEDNCCGWDWRLGFLLTCFDEEVY